MLEVAKISILFLTVEVPETPEGVAELINEIKESPNLGGVTRYNLAHRDMLKELGQLVSSFEIVLIHNTASYDWKFLESVLRVVTQNSLAKIIVMKQDEHVCPYKFDELYCKYEVSAVFTCLAIDYLSLVYPKSVSNGVRFERMYTTYLTKRLIDFELEHFSQINRVSYRGSIQPIWLGSLGRDKALIPKWALNVSKESPSWIFDVSSQWQDRLYGAAWDDLLSRSSAILGSESGSNVFDLDGCLLENTKNFEMINGPLSYDNEELYTKYSKEVLLPYEDNIYYGTIAPRHLEAAMLGKPLILTEGKYEGLFIDNISAIRLPQGFAGLTTALSMLEDQKYREKLTTSAKEEVLSRNDLRIDALLEALKEVIEGLKIPFPTKQFREPMNIFSGTDLEGSIEFAILTPVVFEKDPRHSWWLDSLLNKRVSVEVWEFDSSLNVPDAHFQFREVTSQSGTTSALTLDCNYLMSKQVMGGFLPTLFDPMSLYFLNKLNEYASRKEFSASRFLARLFLRQTSALIHVSKFQTPENMVACDLQSAFAAIVAFEPLNKLIIYDAQESFPDQYMIGTERMPIEDFEFWLSLDSYVMQRVSSVVCMTDGLKHIAKKRSGVEGFVLPNFAPLEDCIRNQSTHSDVTRFVFMGNAAPRRGLENLIEIWDVNSNLAELHFFIPENEYLESLRKLAVKQTSIHPYVSIIFHTAVSEALMITTLAEFDVGIIPYDYQYPYNHCSPNKFGQYLAAGLAIFSNDLDFIAEVVFDNECGLVFNWRDKESFRNAINMFLEVDSLQKFKLNSLRSFKENINWNSYFDSYFDYLKENNLLKFSEARIGLVESIKVQIESEEAAGNYSNNLPLSWPDLHIQSLELVLRWVGKHESIRKIFKIAQRIPLIGPFLTRMKYKLLLKTFL